MFVRVFNVGLVSLCAGCSISPDLVVPKEPDPIELKIIESSNVIQEQITRLHHIRSSKYHEISGDDLTDADLALQPSLLQIVNLGGVWVGDIENLLVKLSSAAGMESPRFLDIRPAGGIPISVNVEYRRVIDVIRDVISQSEHKAVIKIKMKDNLFEVKYVGL